MAQLSAIYLLYNRKALMQIYDEIRGKTAEAENMHKKTIEESLAKDAALIAQAKRIKELEAQVGTDPPPSGGNPPAILNQVFTDGVDWNRFYAEEGDNPINRARFAQENDGLSVTWICGNPAGTKRSELGIRATPGGGETPRRDPINSERWYAIDLMIPQAYILDDAFDDMKRVLWQCHQQGDGIVNPPLSLELRNGTFRLIKSVGAARSELLDPDSDPDGIPVSKGAVHKLVCHVLWKTDNSGYIECWFDGVQKPSFTGPTCSQSTYGMNNKCGSYQPGYTGFPNGYRIEHFIKRWAIGNETNSYQDMA
jgi:hypothetical protein